VQFVIFSCTRILTFLLLVCKATVNSRESGIPKNPGGNSRNLLILGGNFGEFRKFNFLADRTNYGRAIGTVLRLSVVCL